MFLMGEKNKGLYFRNTTKKKPKQLACISSYKPDFRTSLGFVLSRSQEKTTAIPTSNRPVFPEQAQLEGRGGCWAVLSPHFCLPPLQSTLVFPDICMSPSSTFLISSFSTPTLPPGCKVRRDRNPRLPVSVVRNVSPHLRR